MQDVLPQDLVEALSRSVLGRLDLAAGESVTALITQGARELGSGARVALVDRLIGPVATSGALAEQDARDYIAGTPGRAREVHVAGTVLLVHAPSGTDEELVREVTAGIAAALRTRAEPIGQYMTREMQVHSALVQNLLAGDLARIREQQRVPALAQPGAWGVVIRLTVPAGTMELVHRALWQALLPAGAHREDHVVIGEVGAELAILVTYRKDGLTERVIAQLRRAAGHYLLLIGIAAPAPVELLGAAWNEAGQARLRATRVRRLVPASGWGPHSLLQVIPAERLAAWAAAGLQGLTSRQRSLAGLLLRTNIKSTAATYRVTRHGLRQARMHLHRQLGADLSQPLVRAAVLMALYAPALPTEQEPPNEPVDFERDLPVWLLDPEEVRQWALRMLHGLSADQRWLLRTWLDHRDQPKPAVSASRRPRRTIGGAAAALGEHLGVDLTAPQIQADLILALHALEHTEAGVDLPDRAPGRDDWLTRAGLR